MQKSTPNKILFRLTWVVSAIIIFLVDLKIPLGVAGGVLYIALVFLGLLANSPLMIWTSAILGTFLSGIGLVFSPPGGEMWMVLTNRLIGVLTLWMTAGLCLLHYRDQERLRTARGALEQRVMERTNELNEAHRLLTKETGYVQLHKDIAAAANETRSVEEAMGYCLKHICAHAGWPVGHLYLVENTEPERLVSSAIWHLDNPEHFETLREISEATEFETGIGLPGRVLKSGHPAWVIDATLDENFPRAKLVENIGIKAGFAFPVLIGKNVVGVMEFFSREAVEPKPEMLEIMAQVGVHLGRVIERQDAEENREKLLSILKERIKELTCLYQVSHLIRTSESLDAIFTSIETPIIEGWQYPEITRVRVVFDGKSYPSFLPATEWKMSSSINVHGNKRGVLEVYYIEERTQAVEGPFLHEERKLIDALSELLSTSIEQKLAEEANRRSEDELRDLFHRLQKVREEERSRISREFHDGLGQLLTTMKLELSVLDKRLVKSDSGTRKIVSGLRELVDGTLPAVKQMVMDLRPPVLDDLGLNEALAWQARDFEIRTGIKCELILERESEFLDRELTTALFRIFQETLTNVARHSEATQVNILMDGGPEELRLRIQDNGRGILPHQIKDSRSLGILGMKERVLPWGGEISIEGTPNLGTTITITLNASTHK